MYPTQVHQVHQSPLRSPGLIGAIVLVLVLAGGLAALVIGVHNALNQPKIDCSVVRAQPTAIYVPKDGDTLSGLASQEAKLSGGDPELLLKSAACLSGAALESGSPIRLPATWHIVPAAPHRPGVPSK